MASGFAFRRDIDPSRSPELSFGDIRSSVRTEPAPSVPGIIDPVIIPKSIHIPERIPPAESHPAQAHPKMRGVPEIRPI
jgi:hypothetical protein